MGLRLSEVALALQRQVIEAPNSSSGMGAPGRFWSARGRARRSFPGAAACNVHGNIFGSVLQEVNLMRVRIICCVAAIIAFAAPRANASEWDKLTYLTFSAPFQVPGVTLGAGTYTFKLVDGDGNRHIVEILDKRSNKPLAMLMTIPDERIDATDKPVVMFSERPSGTPPAVRAWFYPGNTVGDEFVYPRKQAMVIARATHQRVLAMSDDSASDRNRMKKAGVDRVDGTGTAANSSPAPSVTAPTSSVAQNSAPADTPSARARRPMRKALPQTASNLELFEMLSGLMLAAGVYLRAVRTRLAV
jgi:hypothetical protein